MGRTKHQGNKYADNPEKSGWLKDGFSEWRYKESGEIIPEADLPSVPNAEKIKISYARKVVTLAKPEPHDFVYFDVKHKHSGGTETIGRITEYTTEGRLSSMIYRYYHPGHAQPCTFSGMVFFSGGREGSGTSRMPYIEIPSVYAEASDLRVDDEVSVEIECMDLRYAFNYHLSFMGLRSAKNLCREERRLILPLTLVKRLVVVDDPESMNEDGTPKPCFRYVSKTVYNEHTRMIAKGKPLEYPVSYRPRATPKNPHPKAIITRTLPCRRFIDDRVQVQVSITPEDTTENKWPNAHPGRFDFTTDTIQMFGLLDNGPRRTDE